MVIFSLRRIPFLLLLLILSGCTTKNHHPPMTKMINAQEMPRDKDNSNKMDNLSYEQLMQRANYYRQNKNYRLANLHYQKALDTNTNRPAARIGLGRVLIEEGRLDKATQVLEQALKTAPENTEIMVLLGATARQQGDLRASVTWLNRAYELNPHDPEIMTELAITNDHLGEERLLYAESLYKQVVSLEPYSSAAHNNLGFNYMLQGRHQEAIEIFSKALSLPSANDRAKNNLGAAYLLANEPDKALRLFQGTVGLAAAYNNLGYIHMVLGEVKQAEQAFKKALQINPSFYVRAQQNMEQLNRIQSSTY